MKIIDSNGRLFGKVSVIDVLVVVLAIVFGAALVFRANWIAENVNVNIDKSIPDTPITFQFRVQGVRTYVADALQVGDALYDPDRDNGDGPLGVITDIQVSPGTRLMEYDKDGTYRQTPAEDSVDLLVTVEGTGAVSDGVSYLNRVYQLGVNSNRNFINSYTLVTGVIVSIDPA